MCAERFPRFLRTVLPEVDPSIVRFVPHHLTHAASAALASPGSRARWCDLAAHPCLDAIDPRDVGGAVEKLLRNSSLEREYPRVWKQGTTGILRSKPPTGSTCQAQFRNEES